MQLKTRSDDDRGSLQAKRIRNGQGDFSQSHLAFSRFPAIGSISSNAHNLASTFPPSDKMEIQFWKDLDVNIDTFNLLLFVCCFLYYHLFRAGLLTTKIFMYQANLLNNPHDAQHNVRNDLFSKQKSPMKGEKIRRRKSRRSRAKPSLSKSVKFAAKKKQKKTITGRWQ